MTKTILKAILVLGALGGLLILPRYVTAMVSATRKRPM